jgi:diguanylate cyclase (GGDEF)-like protein
VPGAVFRGDVTGVVTFRNARWDELLGAGAATLHEVVHHDDRAALAAALADLVAGGDEGRAAFEVRAADGVRTLAITCRAFADDDSEHRRIVGSIEDVSATVRLRAEARNDPLTGLLNRKALEERLASALADDPLGVYVAFIDLDDFKEVNDTFGHDAGDKVLTAVAARLRSAVRPEDAVGRYGGDEFVIVCRRIGDRAAEALTGRIQVSLVDRISFAGGTWQPAASLGTARPRPGEDLAAVLRRADQAMFDTKRRRKVHLAPVLPINGERQR